MTAVLRPLLATLAGNTLIAAFLTALGVGGGLAVNLIMSQCIGCSIGGMCALAGWILAPGPARRLALAAAVPVGVAIGVSLGVNLSGIGWSVWPAVAWQAVAIGVTLGVMGSGFFYLRERNLVLAAEVREPRPRVPVQEDVAFARISSARRSTAAGSSRSVA